ncbi:hypothetical protein OGH69_05665 [Flavobacterium sp. MFBS3-15]|uniref:hypothetical protein n=1 Tax=Flavobacterium sp. MFBS3-15 TaxID=2989816 RepID=UPI002235968D|nr:hypothetical protein [Flavobacterium sp. MFBS3-15]MCW4468444.1 hypothetical protein [Flavobacterium sp. MFBS3-15]
MHRLMSFEGMQEYIIDNELTDSVMIALHPESFDTLALDYIRIHETIQRPFEILGIEIIEDTSGTVQKNQVRIVDI